MNENSLPRRSFLKSSAALAAGVVPPGLLNPRDGLPVRTVPLPAWGPDVWAVDDDSRRRLASEIRPMTTDNKNDPLIAMNAIVASSHDGVLT